jgi:cobyrinic acid a,c-diamide synthase
MTGPSQRESMPRIAHRPRLVLGAARSGSGKTTLALGLIAALRRRGLTIGAAKVGPDFIDAAHLAAASAAAARNLDAWLAPAQVVRRSFVRGYAHADTVIVEGVMGLFDGRYGSGEGSTAHLARTLDAPVVLVLDCAQASTTVGAVAYGLARFDPGLRVGGAILNRVASPRHAATVREAVAAAGIPVLGVIRRDERFALPSRHLGLLEPGGAEWTAMLGAIADTVEADVDLDALLALARSAPAIEQTAATAPHAAGSPVRIAIARDDAFWFYDEGSLEALTDAGAALIPYSPLRDPFPVADAVYIGGGYPEIHAAALAANTAARTRLREAIAAGMPAYAECGGLMYLSRALETAQDAFPMVDAVPGIARMAERRSALRYVDAHALGEGPMFARGDRVRGHEFHYSTMQYLADAPAFGIEDEREGYAHGNVHGSYVHVHLAAHESAVRRFLDAARAFGGRA